MDASKITLPPQATFSEQMLVTIALQLREISQHVEGTQKQHYALLKELERAREIHEGTRKAVRSLDGWIYIFCGIAGLISVVHYLHL